MKYADIKCLDVANGTGLRVSIFVSGCRHRCRGCFNENAWDFNYGEEYTNETEEYILDLLENDSISGLSILGGEPLEPENQPYVARLIDLVKTKFTNKNIWLYTGFTFEWILENMNDKFPSLKDIIYNTDVLVDGKFEIDKKDLKLRFRGSSNQRLINLSETLKTGEIILL